MKPGFFTASSSNAPHETIAFLLAPFRARTVVDRWPDSAALVVSSAVYLILTSSVKFFLFFRPTSRGAPKGWGRVLLRMLLRANRNNLVCFA